MGLFKKIKRGFKKIVKGVKKGIKKVVKGVKKVVKKIGSSKILKALAIAAAVVVTGGAALGAMGATAASGGFTGWMVGASSAISSVPVLGTVMAPFKALGTGIGTVGSKLGVNLGQTASQQAAIAGQSTAVPSATSGLSQQQILNTNPAKLAQQTTAGGINLPSTLPTAQTTAGGINLPASLPSGAGATGTVSQQLAQTVPQGLGVPSTASTAQAAQSFASKYPKTSAFLSTVGTNVATSVATGYAMQQLAGDPEETGSMAGLRTEGATDFDPLRVYAAERGIADTDISKYFTFSNAPEGGNMPLYRQETLEIA
tara:strand:+ start:2088 stop:3029 length:942 start_codon:yes stop_codon:yes gene_type:complete